MTSYKLVKVDEILRESEKAILVRLPDDQEMWLPKSQISEFDIDSDATLAVGDADVDLNVAEWLVREKGLATDASDAW